LVEAGNERISVRRQCELLGLNRSGVYYRSRDEKAGDGELMRRLDEQYTRTPWLPAPHGVVGAVGLCGQSQTGPATKRETGSGGDLPESESVKAGQAASEVSVSVERSGDSSGGTLVWATDITYIRLRGGFIYLLAIMDWHSRFVIEFVVSNSLESSVFDEALKRAMDRRPTGHFQL